MKKIAKEDIFEPGVFEAVEDMTAKLDKLHYTLQYARKAMDDVNKAASVYFGDEPKK